MEEGIRFSILDHVLHSRPLIPSIAIYCKKHSVAARDDFLMLPSSKTLHAQAAITLACRIDEKT